MRKGGQEVLGGEVAAILHKGLFLSVAPFSSRPKTQAQVQKFSSFLKHPLSDSHTQTHNCPSPPWLQLTLPGGPFLFQRQEEEGIIEKTSNTSL